MKKLLATALFIVAMATAVSAAGLGGNSTVEALFKAAYPGATNVHFKTVGELVSVSFELNNHNMQAFYDTEGTKVAVSKNIDFTSLSMRGQNAVKQKYTNYTPVETIEMDSQEEGLCYYVSLLDGTQKIVVRVSPGGDVTFFKKLKK